MNVVGPAFFTRESRAMLDRFLGALVLGWVIITAFALYMLLQI